jgi:hypothetical protein
MEWDATEPDARIRSIIETRQTSRKKYHKGPSPELAQKLTRLISGSMKLVEMDKSQTHEAIWLNQRAVFDDFFDEPVRRELDSWLRYSKAEKEEKRDGLAYDCMELNGRLMKFIVHHPGILHAPIISKFLKSYYLRTMADNSTVFYMLAPFKTGSDAYNIGVTIMKLWAEVTHAGDYLHPFGTIMSNQNAHADFLKLAGIVNESREVNYLVFIARIGKSDVPVRSLRLPYQEHLIME